MASLIDFPPKYLRIYCGRLWPHQTKAVYIVKQDDGNGWGLSLQAVSFEFHSQSVEETRLNQR